MTNQHDSEFERQVRDSFRRHIGSLDPLVPALPGFAMTDAPSRVRPARSIQAPGLGLAAAALLILVLALVVGPIPRSGPSAGSPSAGVEGSSTPMTSVGSSAAPSYGPWETIALKPEVVASFGSDELGRAVLGADGAAYVIDSSDSSVYWVNLATGEKLKILLEGQLVGGMSVGTPRLLATGGPDVLILDDANALWRWRPAARDITGRGTIMRMNIPDAVSWGAGVSAIATYVVNAELGLYALYVVDPAANQILKYLPASDGSGFPTANRSSYLAAARDVSHVDDVQVDGKVYLVESGGLSRWVLGRQVSSWTAAWPTGAYYTRLTADDSIQDQGNLYLADTGRGRIVVLRKNDGSFAAEYEMLDTDISSLRGLFVIRGSGNAAALYWTRAGVLERAAIELPVAPTASAAPVPTPGTSSGPSKAASPPASGPTAYPSFLRYVVQAGDNLSSIAARFNVHLWEIELANPDAPDFNHLVVGQILNIPPAGLLTVPPSS